MEYKFYKKVITTTKRVYFLVDVKSEFEVIKNFSFTKNDILIIQEIIDGVEANRTLIKTADPYVWGNEDVTVFANEIGVLLVDKMAMRARQEADPLELTHDEFINFMKDFKKFIEENS